MSARPPRIGEHLIAALAAASPAVRIEGDHGEGITAARWAFATSLQALAARQAGGVAAAKTRFDALKSSLKQSKLFAGEYKPKSSSIDEYETAAQETLAKAEASLTKSKRVLDASTIQSLCEWEAADLTRHLANADDQASRPAEITRETLEPYLRAYLDDPSLVVTECRLLPGGFGKETHLFSTTGVKLSGDFVMRRDMVVTLVSNACHRVDKEFAVLRAVRDAGFPTPDILWVDTEHASLPGGDFIIMRRSPGVAGGTLMGATQKADPELNDRLGEIMGKLHTLPALTQLGALTESIRPEMWQARAHDALRGYLKQYHEMLLASPHAPSPATAAIFNWLIANVPESNLGACLVHGDIGFHNVLLENGRLTAVLDWEFAHIGHPVEDLAYAYNAGAADLDWPRVMRAYVAAGGAPVSERDFLYFRIMMFARNAVSTNLAPSRLLNGDARDLRLISGEYVFRPHIIKMIGELIAQHQAA